MTIIYLIRHAEAEGNLYRRCQGHYNSLVTDNGYRQIEALARRFVGVSVDAVYSSDLFRTMTTARAIYQPRRLPLRTDVRLREVGVGIWEDTPWGNLDREDHNRLAAFTACADTWSVPGGETYPQVRARMCRALEEIAAQHPNQTVAVVSHGSAIRTVLAQLLQLPMPEVPHCDNTAVACLQVEDGVFSVLYHGDNSHLSDEISTFARQSWWRKSAPPDTQMWFRPMDVQQEAELYLRCREEAWLHIHKTMEHYDGAKFLRDAIAHSAYDSRAVMIGMLGEEMAGLIQMDFQKDAERGIGGIPFCYMTPTFRCRKLGAQLLGQAISTYRQLGRSWLRLRCAPDNAAAQYFYRKYGFVKSGVAQDSPVPLDLLDKYIGYDESYIPSGLQL